jgi:hypothetical protein
MMSPCLDPYIDNSSISANSYVFWIQIDAANKIANC